MLLLAAVPGLGAEIVLANRQVSAMMAVSPWQRRRFFYRMLLTDHCAAKEVRQYGLGAHFRGRQIDALRRSQDVHVRLAARTATVQSGLGLLGAVVALRVVRGEAGADVLLFMSAVAGVQAGLSELVARIGSTLESVRMFQRYLEVMALRADLPAGDLRGAVRFGDVWFRYQPDGPWVLRGGDVRIPAGSTLAVVGVNGAGKSTVVKLLVASPAGQGRRGNRASAGGGRRIRPVPPRGPPAPHRPLWPDGSVRTGAPAGRQVGHTGHHVGHQVVDGDPHPGDPGRVAADDHLGLVDRGDDGPDHHGDRQGDARRAPAQHQDHRLGTA